MARLKIYSYGIKRIGTAATKNREQPFMKTTNTVEEHCCFQNCGHLADIRRINVMDKQWLKLDICKGSVI